MKYVLILFALALLSLNFVNYAFDSHTTYDGKEKYNAQLSSLNSVANLEKYADSIAKKENIGFQTYEYVELLDSIMSQRFFFGYSYYKMSDNFILVCTDYIFKKDFGAVVNTDKIMESDHAACSQQSLVIMNVLRHKGIDYRKVAFPNHYTLEAIFGKDHYYFDPTNEPTIKKNDRLLSHWNGISDSLQKFYPQYQPAGVPFDGDASFGPVNEIPAKKVTILQNVTWVLSKIAWIFPLLLLFWLQRRKRSKRSAAL